MAENFDLIFGESASSQYAWNDSDYQNGWGTVGSTPPTAEQFDALQRRSDKKAQELNNALTPLVNQSTASNRQPLTAYALKDIRYYNGLPVGWYLECSTAGTTSSGDITLPSPLVENATITDGTVTWKVRKISSADGVPIATILPFASNGSIPSGYLLCDGAAVSRTMFPDLFATIGTTYGAGDGSTTFNVPDYNVAQRFAQGSTVAGTVKQAGLPDHSHQVWGSNGEASSGAYLTGTIAEKDYATTTLASESNPIYGNSTTVQPPALTARYIIKAFDGQTADSALIDITQYAADLANKADRSLSNLTQTGEDHFLDNDFTIIYPNGGTEANPANVTTNSRYVESNPFPGYRVACKAEVYFTNKWGAAEWFCGSINGSPFSDGTCANQLDNDSIIIQTGLSTVLAPSANCGSPFGAGATGMTSLPCRVKVWKIGKIPT